MVSKSSKNSAGGPAADRAEQQAQALRDNLRRRKGQARARRDEQPDGHRDKEPTQNPGAAEAEERPKV